MLRGMSASAVWVAAWLIGAASAGAQMLSSQDVQIYREAFAALESGDPSAALVMAARADNQLPAKILYWEVLSRADTPVTFAEIASFLDHNPDWPRQETMRRRAEEAITGDEPPGEILTWFITNPPVSGIGHLKRAAALLATGDEVGAATAARQGWILADFEDSGQADQFRRQFDQFIRPEDNIARLDRLLWDEQIAAAEAMLNAVSGDYRLVARARLLLMQEAPGVDAAVAAVPERLLTDPGLVYERLRWRRRNDLDADARAMLALPTADSVHAEKWWTERGILARRAFEDGLISEAYELAANHEVTTGEPFSEAEFFAGWMALRYLDDPHTAYDHFLRLYNGVKAPISLARGAYWIARSLDQLGDVDNARGWYGNAAQYSNAYYGQIAAAQLDPAAAMTIPTDPVPSDDQVLAVSKREPARAAAVLEELGMRNLTGVFITALIDHAGSAADHAAVVQYALSLGRIDLAAAAARRAARNGVILVSTGFPLVEIPATAAPAEPALILGVMRQESNFDSAAISPAGARGLMQLMPATAERVAAALGLGYSESRLTSDPDYNVQLGSTYLLGRVEDFRGSYIMAIAAYNAGPNRVEQWVAAFGDPREPDVDPIDWVETIPFRETRNYVQRVLEGTQVYRYQLGLNPQVGTILEDLRRGSAVGN